MSSISIADALFTKTQQRVLGLLYGKTEQSYYTNEIVRWADMGRGTVRRELERLVGAGLLVVSREGNQLHYKANQENPVFNELQGIVRKTFGVADVIRDALSPLDDLIEFVFIYGSIAKGEATASSDIDLFVVSEAIAYSKLMGALAEAGEMLGRIVNPSIYSKQDVLKKISEGNAFITRVMEQEKIWVKGSDDDIKEFR